jgi:fused signal recognition particle receptor
MNNISLPIIFLVLAVVVLVFGFGVVWLNRRKPAAPVVQRATPITKTAVVEKVVAEEVLEEVVVEEAAVEVVEKASVRDRLSKARSAFGGAVTSVLTRSEISDTTWDELEEALLRADVGVRVAQELMQPLRARVKSKDIVSPQQLIDALRQDMSAHLVSTDRELRFDATIEGPNIWLMVGVNGAGKTTSIGKISAQQTALGRTVMMAAGDTFRAAAGEQLATWAERSGAEIIRGAEGGDPSSVIFDAVQAANARNIDLVLADTAGRLQSNTNLMEELRKVRRVAEKGAGTVTEVLLVIDATTGQNGLSQARVFAEATQVTGVVLTKLDGSAKGGIVFAIETELGIPIKLVGLGETITDLVAFNPIEFVDALFGSLRQHDV